MSHTLAWLKQVKYLQEAHINVAIKKRLTRNPEQEQRVSRELAKETEAHLMSLRLIGSICVQYNLPAGNPCWMAANIANYF